MIITESSELPHILRQNKIAMDDDNLDTVLSLSDLSQCLPWKQRHLFIVDVRCSLLYPQFAKATSNLSAFLL